MSEVKKCSGCVNSVVVDFGYSNWTVEGSVLHCAKNLNPKAPFDKWYGTDKRDLFAEECAEFKEGDNVSLDVDLEDLPYKMSEEDKNLTYHERLLKYYGNGYVTVGQLENIVT